MVLSSPSSDREIRARAHELLKDPIGITMNPHAEEFVIHKRYCHLLRIEDTLFAQFMADDLRLIGRSEVYASAPISDRILSTNGLDIPPVNITDCRDPPNKERTVDVAGGTAKTSEVPMVPKEHKRSLLPDTLRPYPVRGLSQCGAVPKGGLDSHEAGGGQHQEGDARDGVDLSPLPSALTDLSIGDDSDG